MRWWNVYCLLHDAFYAAYYYYYYYYADPLSLDRYSTNTLVMDLQSKERDPIDSNIQEAPSMKRGRGQSRRSHSLEGP